MGARPSSFAAPVVAPVPTREWSPQQQAIFDWFKNEPCSCGDFHDEADSKNLTVTARAGSGKTTVILEGVTRAPEDDILIAAFGKEIQEELSRRNTNPRVTIKTLHSLGYAMIRRQWRGLKVAEGSARRDFLTDAALKQTEKELGEKVPFQIRRLITELHGKMREITPLDPSYNDAVSLAFRFELTPDEGWGQFDLEFVALHALAAVHYAGTVEPTYDIGIDFADMIFLPLAWNLTARDYDLVVVDEAQDMTVAQLELAQRSCRGRICVVGDDKQAIFGFRGADSSSLGRLTKELSAAQLPLTVTYRCGRKIVEYAQELVPDIQAKADAHEGAVAEASTKQMMDSVKPGDFILSRLNAPLVTITLRLLRNGIRARMKGRDLGKGTLSILRKLKVDRPGTDIDVVMQKVDEWQRKQCAKLAAYGQQDQIARVQDQAGMILAFAEDADSTAELLAKCESLFTDNAEDAQVLCSSVHKAKGLEADTVWVLMDTLYRWGKSPEEDNIHYVAATRAKQQLWLVKGDK